MYIMIAYSVSDLKCFLRYCSYFSCFIIVNPTIDIVCGDEKKIVGTRKESVRR